MREVRERIVVECVSAVHQKPLQKSSTADQPEAAHQESVFYRLFSFSFKY